MNKTKGFIALLLSGIIYSANDVFIKILGLQLSGFQQVTLRCFIAFILVIGTLIIGKSKINIKNIPKKFLFLYGLSFPLMFVFFNFSILLTKIADTVFSFFIASIISAFVFEHFIYKEKITKEKIISTIITLAGLTFFAFPVSNTSINTGFLSGLMSGVIYTFSSSLIQHIDKKIDKFVLVGVQMFGGVIISGILTAILHQSLFPKLSFLSIIILFISSSFLMLVTYLTLIGFQNFDLNLGTITLSSELFFAPLFAFIIFRESLTIFEIIGGILIGLAIITPEVNWKKFK